MLFYGIRGVLQANFTFKMPVGGYWGFPGIPSIMVPYGLASDFYYSGHTGYLVTILIETVNNDKRNWKLLICMVFVICYMITILLLFKIHYVIGNQL